MTPTYFSLETPAVNMLLLFEQFDPLLYSYFVFVCLFVLVSFSAESFYLYYYITTQLWQNIDYTSRIPRE